MIGKDGEFYVTMVDKSGKQVFEPVKATLSVAGEQECVGYNGYFGVRLADEDGSISNAYAVMDANGKVHEVGVDDLSALGKETILAVGNEELISGGYVFEPGADSKKDPYVSARYVGIDAKTVIDSCHE